MNTKLYKYLVRPTLGLLGVCLLLLFLLHTSWGLTLVGKTVLRQLDIFPGATLTVDKISGSPFGNLSAADIALKADNDSLLLSIEQVDVEYSLRQILRGEYVFQNLAIASPHVRMTQADDHAWDVIGVLPESDTTSVTPYVQFDNLSITKGTIAAHAFATDADSTYYIRDLNLLLSPLTLDDGLTLSLDHLAGEVWVPDTHEPVDIWLAAHYDGVALALDSLQLSSSRSNVTGDGRLYLTTADSLLYQNTLSLTANPLSFDDVRLFAPSLQPGAEVEMTVTIDGAPADGINNQLIADADIQFSDGASIELDGTWKKRAGSIGAITLTSNISSLNPEVLTTNPNLAANLNAAFNASFSGESFKTLDGTSMLSLFASSFQSHALDSSIVRADFERGIATIEATTGLTEATLGITGTIAPFAAQPAYNLTGDLARLNLHPFVPDSTMETNLNATMQLNGAGFSLEEVATELTLTFLPSRINDYRITEGNVTAELADAQIAHTLQLDSRSGRITSTGETRLGTTVRLDSLSLALDAVDVAALQGDTTRRVVTANASLTGSIDETGNIEAQIDAILPHVVNDNILIKEAVLSGSWADNTLTLQTQGDVNEGKFEIAGMARLEQDNLAFEITEASFSDVDIAKFTEDENNTQTSILNGSFFLVGQGDIFETGSVSGQIELQPSQLNQQRIEGASVWVALQSDTLSFDLSLDLPEGTSRLAGRVEPLKSIATFQLTQGEFNGINVGALAGIDSLSTDLNGTLLITGKGTALENINARADLLLRPSQINALSVDESRTTIVVSQDEGTLNSNVVFNEGRLDVIAEAFNVSSQPTFQLKANVEALDVAGLIGADSIASKINAEFDGEGYYATLDSIAIEPLYLTGQLRGYPSNYGDIILDSLDIDMTLDKGRFMMDTLLTVSNVARATGSGAIVLSSKTDLPEGLRNSTFEMRTSLQDLTPLEPFLGVSTLTVETGTLRTRVLGQPENLRTDTRIQGSGFVYNTFHLGSLNARVTGEFDENQSLSNTDVTGTISAVSIPGFVFEEIELEVNYDSTIVDFETKGRLDKDRRVEVFGNLDLNSEARALALDSVRLNLDEDIWTLQQPARFTLGPAYAVDNFLMKSGTQHIELSGGIDLEGEQNLLLDIKNFGVGTVADLLGFTGLDGPVTSQLNLTGPAASPILDGSLDMAIKAFDKDAGDLSIEVEYDSLALNLNASLTQTGKKVGSVNGVLPVDLSLTTPEASTTGAGISQNVAMEGGVDFAIQADSMAINWILPFIDPSLLNRLEGALTADIKIEGTAQDPTLEGAGRLVDGRIRSPLLGVTYEDFSSDIALNDNIIQLTNASMRSGEGFVSGNGSIELSDLTSAILDIDLTASEFLAIDTREYRATASGNMDLTGTLQEPVLNGDVTVLSADLFLNESTSSELADLNVQLTREDLLMLERNFGIRASAADTTTFDFLEALKMDVEILFGRDVWIRSKKNPEMNMQFSGELDVSKEPFDEYIAFGNIEIIPDRSYINQFGKRFDITLGSLNFNGPATDPEINFEARYEVPARRSDENAVTIYLDAEGKVEELDLTLRAEPTMELTDILSYIATGQPASEALQLGGINSQSLASTGAGFAINQGVGLLTGAIETLLQDSGLELDVIQIEPSDNARGATITAGKYVTPRIFTAVSQPIGAADSDGTSTREESTIITLELELIDSLLLRLLGGESVLQINLLWHHSY